ncbi:MAG: FAD-dependent monooxygenase, partial [Caldilineaceae bacterium]|nr:FAD-dependent monooxygenase [Caldilineaceae bacterium]
MKALIIGGGIGGLCAAIALRRGGHEVHVFEQAHEIRPAGAGITLWANALSALQSLGVYDALRTVGTTAAEGVIRTASGQSLSEGSSDALKAKLGLQELLLIFHRADLHRVLQAQIEPASLHTSATCHGFTAAEDKVTAHFADGAYASGDFLIGADGIHSVIRTALFGEDRPRFTGLVSWRAVVPRTAVAGLDNLDSFTKWWGPEPERQIVTFPLTGGDEIFIFATTPQQGWGEEGWTLPGDVAELQAAYADFHPQARALLAGCTTAMRSALHVRDPMERWSRGAVTLLGDAAHPMVPFMAQGACMAIEDA